MNEFIQAESPLNFNNGETQSKENSGHNRSIPENVICEVETGAKVTQEETDQPDDIPPEEPSQVDLNIENIEKNRGHGDRPRR